MYDLYYFTAAGEDTKMCDFGRPCPDRASKGEVILAVDRFDDTKFWLDEHGKTSNKAPWEKES